MGIVARGLLLASSASANLIASATSCLVSLRDADQNDGIIAMGRLAVDRAIGMARWIAAPHADGPQLDDLIGNAQELWHRPERLAAKVLVQTCENDLFPFIGEFDSKVDQR